VSVPGSPASHNRTLPMTRKRPVRFRERPSHGRTAAPMGCATGNLLVAALFGFLGQRRWHGPCLKVNHLS
jgi:hypothetical protein